MTIDPIEAQLARYGTFLRSQLDHSDATQLTIDSKAPLQIQPRRRPSARTLLRVAAVLGPLVALVVGLIAFRPEPDDLVAVPVESPEEIEQRANDSDAFVGALGGVDFEVKARGPREPSDQERQAIVAEFEQHEGDVIDESVTIMQDLDSGALVIEFDVVPTEENELGNGIVTDRCQVIATRGLSDMAANGYSCFDPDYDQFEENDIEYVFSYGCQPAYGFPGGALFGRRDFEAIVGAVAESPGVIFTLENGDQVLVRPTDGLAVYTGPPAVEMTIYTANGDATTIRTNDCL